MFRRNTGRHINRSYIYEKTELAPRWYVNIATIILEDLDYEKTQKESIFRCVIKKVTIALIICTLLMFLAPLLGLEMETLEYPT